MEVVKILGIDPGSKVTGFCLLGCKKDANIFSPSSMKIIDAGAIRPNKNASHSERTGQLHNSLYEIVKTHRPDLCVIERAFTGINPHSALRLGETRGALISAARRLNVPIEEVSPTQVKKTTTGQGHASKEQIARAVELLLGFKRGNLTFDVTDAIAIALCQAMLGGTPKAFKERKYSAKFIKKANPEIISKSF